jgi:hypothetical protein
MVPALRNLIESIVKQTLDEAAKSQSDAMSQNLALYVQREDGVFQLVLYDPSLIQNIRSSIIGFIKVKFKNGCGNWIVKYAAANNGFGPLMYELAMSLIYPDYLRSDNESVSSEAQRVWTFFLKNRRSEFKSEKVADQAPGKTNCLPALGTKEEGVQYSFSINNPINYSNLEETHEKVAYDMRIPGRKEFQTKLVAAGEAFFWRMYT